MEKTVLTFDDGQSVEVKPITQPIEMWGSPHSGNLIQRLTEANIGQRFRITSYDKEPPLVIELEVVSKTRT